MVSETSGSIDCPDANRLLDFSAGKLPAAELSHCSDHVATCQRCVTILSTFDESGDSLHALLRGLPNHVAPPGLQCASLVAAVEGLLRKSSLQAELAGRSQIGPYELLAKLGEGGMGAVYKALHVHLGKPVALKTLPAQRASDSAAIQRLRREMKAVGSLQHPNIVAAHDGGEDDGVHFLVMEYVDGIDLSKLARRVGRLAVADACELARQAALGLEYAHRQGLIHRDIKPSNLMLDSRGQIKILDLGLALFTHGPADELTASGRAMGTLDYMAPEQAADSHEVDARADVYSLGCTLFRLLTGQAPYAGPQCDTPIKKMMAHANRPIPSTREQRADVPPALDALVQRAMAKQPAARFATAAEMAEALAPFCAGSQLLELSANALSSAPHVGGSIAPTSADQQNNVPLRAAAAPAAAIPGPTLVLEGSSSPPKRTRMRWLAAAGALSLLCASFILLKNEAETNVAQLEQLGQKPPEPQGDAPERVELPAASTQVANMTWRPGLDAAYWPGLAPRPADFLDGQEWQIEQLAPREGHVRLAWNPQGNLLAVGGNSCYLRLYAFDGHSLELLHVAPGHRNGINDMAWSPDGQQLASSSTDHSVIIWTIAGESPPRIARQLTHKVRGSYVQVAWLADGQHVAAAKRYDEPRGVMIWNVADGSIWREAYDPDFEIERMEASSVVNAIAFACANGGIWIWMMDEERPRQIHAGEALDVTNLAFDVSGQRLAWADKSGEPRIHLWDVVEAKPDLTIDVGTNWRGLAWSRDGNRIFAGGADQVALYDVAARRLVSTFPGSMRYSIAHHPNEELIAIDNSDMRDPLCVRVIEPTPTGKVVAALAHEPMITALAWNADGTSLAVGGGDRSLRLVSASNGVQLKNIAALDQSPNSLAWVDADHIAVATRRATGSDSTAIDIISVSTGSPTGKLSGHSSEVSVVGAGPNGQYLASGSTDKTVRVWDLKTERSLVLRGHRSSIVSLSWGPSGKQLASVDGASLIVWDIAAGTPALTLDEPYEYVAWSPQGDLIGLADGGSRQFRSLDGELVWETSFGSGERNHITWNSQGDRVGITDPYSLRIFDAKTGMPQTTKKLAATVQDKIFHASYSPDGKLVAVTRGDNRLEMWDAATARLLWTTVLLRNGHSAVISAAGELLTSSPEDEAAFAYFVKQDDGTATRLTPAEFRKLVELKPTQHFGGRTRDLPASAPEPAVAPFDAEQARKHQEAWAEYLGVPVETTNTIGMRMVLIPPGEFLMGCSDEEAADEQYARNRQSERPQHQVTLTRPFLMGATEVTIGQFRQFIEATKHEIPKRPSSSLIAPELNWESPGYAVTDDTAVTLITWRDAAVFCQWLNEIEGDSSSNDDAGNTIQGHYRLATEAQWEYACRAGTTTAYSCGDDPALLTMYAWFDKDGPLQPVGKKLPNAFGLFDMHGNAQEWCNDFRGLYEEGPRVDPYGPGGGTSHVSRGGSWLSSSVACRNASRSFPALANSMPTQGFRVVRTLELSAPAPPPAIEAAPDTAPAPSPAVAPFDAEQARKHQEAWAEHLGVPVETTNSIGTRMVLIPPGEFMMAVPMRRRLRNSMRRFARSSGLNIR